MVNFYISKEKNGIKKIIINVKEGKWGGQNNLGKKKQLVESTKRIKWIKIYQH